MENFKKNSVGGEIKVVKRNGSEEDFDAGKINKMILWATKGVSGVDENLIAINAKLSLSSKINTKDIQQAIIEAASDLFTENEPNYSLVAGRLMIFGMRKEVWGGKNPPRLVDFIRKNTDLGIYDPRILESYTEAELNKLDEKIQHDRDLSLEHCSVQQMRDKYLYSNQYTKQLFETPSFAYMLIAMASHLKEDKAKRVTYVKRAYDAYTKKKLNLPSPMMAKLRTNTRSYASCCLIPVMDTLESINAARTFTAQATSKGYGIGLDVGRLRPIGSPIRGGEVLHTGVIPYLKTFESIVVATLQGSRGGSATVTFPIWHYEIEDILQLKNNRGTDSNRVRRLDYSIGMSKIFYERLIKGGKITLFNPNEVPGLYEAFGLPEFDALYEKYEADKSITMKKTVDAVRLFTLLAEESIETGRIYILNIDNVNSHSPWINKVEFSNLCVDGETKILIKQEEEIKTIKIKDLSFYLEKGETFVNSYDTEEKSESFEKILDFSLMGEESEIFEIEDERGNVLECTGDHKIFTQNRGYVMAKDLTISDNLVAFSFGKTEQAKVFDIKKIKKQSLVYDITVEKNSNFFANNILVHNCQEILHHIVPFKNISDEEGEIGICTLLAINVLDCKNDAELEEACSVGVRQLDNILDDQEYFSIQAHNFATKKRSLGIGITNLAALLAKNGLKYSSEDAIPFVDELMEKIQFYCIKASMELAKERGPAEKFNESNYSLGIFPIDNYKKTLDQICSRPPSQNWDWLRAEVKEHGMRNMTLTALMPCEASSQALNSTNGFDPIQSRFQLKESKNGFIKQMAPGNKNWVYETCFDLPNNTNLIKLYSIAQKWIDMSISANRFYSKNKLSVQTVLQDILLGYKLGMKTWYYAKKDDGHQSSGMSSDSCSSGACSV